MQVSSPIFSIFHFNDVYSLQPEEKEPKGGAAYFGALLRKCKSLCPQHLTFFSGDVFSPALLSTQFKGVNMIQPLNSFGIDVACFGNHELDYGLEQVMKLIKMTNFPWLLSNVYDKRTQRRLAEGEEYRILQINGVRVGVFSLAQPEWIDTLYPFYKEICECLDFIIFARQMVIKLRQELKCDMVIALTHMMKYNDIKLANTVQGIDLILGGHDHLVLAQQVGHSFIVKSGCDFKNFSIIEVYRQVSAHSAFGMKVELRVVNHEKEKIEPDPQLDNYITGIYKEFKLREERVAIFTDKQLDLRFSVIRHEPSSLLEFIVSIYRHETGADCAIMNSGNFRMDCVIKAGPIKFGTITSIITDKVIVKRVLGKALLIALENSVSMYPNLSGRYSAVSGITFTWDSRKQPLQRIVANSVWVQEEKLDLGRQYKVAMHSFTGDGGDGYECFKACPQISRGNNDKLNVQLLHDLFTMNPYLLNTYKRKYPDRYREVDYDGKKYLELTLAKPKNVTMIS